MNRILSVLALVALVLVGARLHTPAFAQETPSVVRMQGNPLLGDFQILSNKRAELRVSIARRGRAAAFSDWLRSERPAAYKQALASKPASIAKAASSCCEGGCCKSGSCCSGQSACCSDKSPCCKENGCSAKACDVSKRSVTQGSCCA
jgi:hypothetical protein